MGRQRSHDLDRPSRVALPPDAQRRPLELPRLRPQPGPRHLAASHRQLRRQHGPLLHRRRGGREPRGRRRRRDLGHLAHRRLRRQPGRLLRRAHRQRARLQPRAQRHRDPDRHEHAGHDRERGRSDTAGEPRRDHAGEDVARRPVVAVDRRHRRHGLQPLSRRQPRRQHHRDDVHLRHAELLDELRARRRGARRQRERLEQARQRRVDGALRRPGRARRRLLVRRRLGRECGRRLRQRPRRRDLGRYVDECWPLRQRAQLRRRQRPGRARQPGHLLPGRLHAPGLGAEADRHQERRRNRRHLDRDRPDALGRPSRHALSPHARRQLFRVPRLRSEPRGFDLAAHRRHLRRHDRSLLHRRRAGLEPCGCIGRQLRHLAHRRVRRQSGWLLRRRHRRRPRLQPRTRSSRDPHGHESAGAGTRLRLRPARRERRAHRAPPSGASTSPGRPPATTGS